VWKTEEGTSQAPARGPACRDSPSSDAPLVALSFAPDNNCSPHQNHHHLFTHDNTHHLQRALLITCTPFPNCHSARALSYDCASSDSGHCHLAASPILKQLNQPILTTAHQHRHAIASASSTSQLIHQQLHTAAMSGQGKLDQSLDEIMKDTKPARAGRGRAPRRAAAVKSAAATAAPAGGIAKKTRAPKGPRNAAPVAAAIPVTGESKIIVSGLVSQILPYFLLVRRTTNTITAWGCERTAD
jgi:hypothetical protein